MSLDQKAVDKFTSMLAKSTAEFQTYLNSDFRHYHHFNPMHANMSTETLQEMAFFMAVYTEVGEYDASIKKGMFVDAVRIAKPNETKSSAITERLGEAKMRAHELENLAAKYNILDRKFRVLDYWVSVTEGDHVPELKGVSDLWKDIYFLNNEPHIVRPVLEAMIDDANTVLAKPSLAMDATLTLFKGIDAEADWEFTKDEISRSIKAEAALVLGVGVSTEVNIEYKGFTATFQGEAFAGIRAAAGLEATVDWGAGGGIDASAEVSVEMGLMVNASVEADLGGFVGLEGSADAIAGALANGSVHVVINGEQLSLEASAAVFAGVRVSGEATANFQIGHREIFSASVNASASAGVGFGAGFSVDCSVLGKFSVSGAIDATLGLGAGAGWGFSFDPQQLHYGAVNIYYGLLNDLGYKKDGKAFFLPLEENLDYAQRTREYMFNKLNQTAMQHQQANEDLKRFRQASVDMGERLRAWRGRATSSEGGWM
ncbi:MAG: hypothetical protein VX223_16390 [Myxococcota bacterium]|nr:hypothetical protein [Myxococcota bacterium]